MTENTKKLKEIFWKIIKKLNDMNSDYGGIFDCGELGIIEVYWDHGCWQYEIYEKPDIIKIENFLDKTDLLY